jgi:hypothetical protein
MDLARRFQQLGGAVKKINSEKEEGRKTKIRLHY